MTLSKEGRALFLGMHQGGYSTLRTRPVTNFIESAGVTRPAACTGAFVDYFVDEPAFPPSTIQAYRLGSASGSKHLIVVVNCDTTQARDVTVAFPAGPEGRAVAELKRIERIELRGTSLSTTIPAGQVRLYLLAAPDVVGRALAVQAETAKAARLFPWHCSRHFFVRRPIRGARVWGAVHKQLRIKATELEALPNCLIVLPDSPTEGDVAFAQTVVSVIEAWPLAKNKLRIPVRKASEVSRKESKSHNLLLVGTPDENAWTRAECSRVGLNADAAIVSHHERGWYTGDSFVAVLGQKGDRRAPFSEFLDWMRLWIDGSGRYIPDRTWR